MSLAARPPTRPVCDMVIGIENIPVPESVITVVVPVAIYFLILGLLNSRKSPQLLTGLEDSLLLVGCGVLLAVPTILSFFGATGLAITIGLAVVGTAACLFRSRSRVWVIYNLPAVCADKLVEDVLKAMGKPFIRDGDQFLLAGNGRVEVSSFALLRSVSVRLHECDEQLRRQFGEILGRATARMSAETSPGAMALLLVAMAMLVAPLTVAAHKAGEIARFISDLLQ